MAGSLLDAVDPANEVTLFLRGAFTGVDVVAVAAEPFLDLLQVGEALAVGCRRQRLDLAMRRRLAGLTRAGGVAGAVAHGLATARLLGAVQPPAALAAHAA